MIIAFGFLSNLHLPMKSMKISLRHLIHPSKTRTPHASCNCAIADWNCRVYILLVFILLLQWRHADVGNKHSVRVHQVSLCNSTLLSTSDAIYWSSGGLYCSHKTLCIQSLAVFLAIDGIGVLHHMAQHMSNRGLCELILTNALRALTYLDIHRNGHTLPWKIFQWAWLYFFS